MDIKDIDEYKDLQKLVTGLKNAAREANDNYVEAYGKLAIEQTKIEMKYKNDFRFLMSQRSMGNAVNSYMDRKTGVKGMLRVHKTRREKFILIANLAQVLANPATFIKFIESEWDAIKRNEKGVCNTLWVDDDREDSRIFINIPNDKGIYNINIDNRVVKSTSNLLTAFHHLNRILTDIQ